MSIRVMEAENGTWICFLRSFKFTQHFATTKLKILNSIHQLSPPQQIQREHYILVRNLLQKLSFFSS